MKTKRKKPNYVEEPTGEGWAFDQGKALTRAQQRALGLPSASAAAKMSISRKPARPARINIRTTSCKGGFVRPEVDYRRNSARETSL